MAPTPNTLRLADLSPVLVAEETVAELREHARHLNGALGLQTTPPTTVPIRGDIILLVEYAKSGSLGGLSRGRTRMARLLEELGTVYYGSPDSPTLRPLGNQGTALGLVYVAAAARLELAAGRAVEHHGLAALAGVHPSRIHALGGGKTPVLIRTGPPGYVTAASALAWLRTTKTPGFAQRGPKG